MEPEEPKAKGSNPIQKVKQNFRPDWIDSDNKIYINKLNFICDNFDKNHEDVKKLRNKVYKTHVLEIEDLYSRTREVVDDFKTTKEKVLAMEDNLPKIVREMIAFYIDQRFEKRFDTFMTKEEFKDKISYKMDYTVFNDF